MQLVRIQRVEPVGQHWVELTLTNGQVVRRDLGPLLTSPAFAKIRADDSLFGAVQVEAGGLVWPGGKDLCPDAVLWGGLPADGMVPEQVAGAPV